MNRCGDHFEFAVSFAGIGYIVLWPVTADGTGGPLFGASVLCGDRSGRAFGPLCRMPHLLTLPLGLHLLGFTAVLLLTARLACVLICRLRPRGAMLSATAARVRLARVFPLKARSKPGRRPRKVKPRDYFGLRGIPR
jgi:hypothetical protein